jgi:hypothetical protein
MPLIAFKKLILILYYLPVKDILDLLQLVLLIGWVINNLNMILPTINFDRSGLEVPLKQVDVHGSRRYNYLEVLPLF